MEFFCLLYVVDNFSSRTQKSCETQKTWGVVGLSGGSGGGRQWGYWGTIEVNIGVTGGKKNHFVDQILLVVELDRECNPNL